MEMFSGGSISIICGSMLISGEADIIRIENAVKNLYRLNRALRIRIKTDGGEVSQSVWDYIPQNIPVLHFDNEASLNDYAEEYTKNPLSISGSLCEFHILVLPGQYGLLLKLHHFIGDAWTLSLLGTQFNRLMKGQAVEAYSYEDYVENENAYILSKRYQKDKTFFLEQFKKCDEVTYLSEKQANVLDARRCTFVIDGSLASRINEYACQKGTSAFMLFTAALSIYINRIKMNAEKFYIGTAVLNRSGVKEQNTAGMFVNTVPMLIELNNDASFAENLSVIEETAFSVFRHQKFNYGDVLAAIREQYHFSEKLYDVSISYQNARIMDADVKTTWYHNGAQAESLQVHIDDRDNEGVFRIHYDYSICKFSEKDIEHIHSHICELLFDAVANDNEKIRCLKLLLPDEENLIRHTFNQTTVDFPNAATIVSLFEEQVQKYPERTALIAADKTLSYRELNEQANRIAHSILAKRMDHNSVVALMLPRKSYLACAILGILKAGAAYLPVDQHYPKDRIDFMLSDSHAGFCISEENIDELLSSPNTANPGILIDGSHRVYCIYTSGSTGKPKGTVILHKNLLNNVLWRTTAYQDTETDYVVSVSNITTDTFQEEFFYSLMVKSVFSIAEDHQNLESIDKALVSSSSIFMTTPTFFKSIAQYTQWRFQGVILVGEKLEDALANEIFDHHIALYNEYGPSECTICSTFSRLKDDIHIGKPIANTQIYIVDQYMNLVPVGVIGELCIAGAGVGAGYLNRPELTAEKFVVNPFGEGMLYKTGDLAYWRDDGNIEYIGRNDFQVKIRGLRIEPGEIENAICSMGGIDQAVVTVRKNKAGRQLICAFYTGRKTDARALRNHIGRQLPKYMLPHIFTHIQAMPLTSSGKVNRKTLPEVDLENITNDTPYIAPVSDIQKALCSIAQEVLGTVPIGIGEDFFDLGGDSLKAIEFVSKAHNEGIYFSLQQIFDHPTIRQLSESIENNDRLQFTYQQSDFEKIDPLLNKNRIEHMAAPALCPVGNLMLTGATGYLGSHILADYLDHDGGIAWCLVRGKDQKDSERRLQEMLSFYFGDKYSKTDRIRVLCGDLQKDHLGLTAQEYASLQESVNTVINCAASVKHYGTYQHFHEVNVVSVQRLIRFCQASGAKLIHTSTVSVSGNSFGDDFSSNHSQVDAEFSESMLYFGQSLENVYVRSKFEAEKAVLEAMAEGLQANIMRVGQLSNRYSDGVFQKNHESNAYLKRLKAMADLGKIPENLRRQYTEFTPVDKAAQAIMLITRSFSNEQTVFHIENPHFVFVQELAARFTQLGYPVQFVSQHAFSELIEEMGRNEDSAYLLESFINDLDENNLLSYENGTQISVDFTVAYLRGLGFEWPVIDWKYLQKYINYFRRIGYFK